MSGPTTRSNRTRVPVETPLRGRSRQGCWTCRIRRKKCDELMDDNGLCHHCSRLGIECIGWGEKRPEWLKDPEKLDYFKQSMKKQILARTRSSSVPLADPNISIASAQMVDRDPEELDVPASGAVLLASCWESADDFALSPVINPPPYDPGSQHGIAAVISPHLSLSSSILLPALMDPYDYRFFVENVQILAAAADLPATCERAVREIAALGLWKHDQLRQDCLSYRELVKRSSGIEQELLDAYEQTKITVRTADAYTRKPPKGEDMLQFMHIPGDAEKYSTPNLGFPQAPSCAFPAYSLQEHMQTEAWPGIPFDSSINPIYPPMDLSAYFIPPTTSDGLLTPGDRPQAYAVALHSPAAIPCLASLLFLYAVISGINQRVPEIISTSDEIMDVLRAPGMGDTVPKMQALLAITLAGCLSEKAEIHDMFAHMITTIDDDAARISALALGQKMDIKYSN